MSQILLSALVALILGAALLLLLNRVWKHSARMTWEDEVILAAQAKRYRQNQRWIKENNPRLVGSRKCF